MKILINKDSNNKIEKLIQKSEDTGYRILTLSTQKAFEIQRIAEEKDIKIPMPLELNQYKDKYYKPTVIRDEGIIIDDFTLNMEKVMEDYLGTNVKIGVADEDDTDNFITTLGKYSSTRFGSIPAYEVTAVSPRDSILMPETNLVTIQDFLSANYVTLNLNDPTHFITVDGTTIN